MTRSDKHPVQRPDGRPGQPSPPDGAYQEGAAPPPDVSDDRDTEWGAGDEEEEEPDVEERPRADPEIPELGSSDRRRGSRRPGDGRAR